MKRSKTIRLVALGSLPLVLSACGDRPTKIVSETKRYQDVDYCVMDGKPRQVCQQAWVAAQNHHAANVPRFLTAEACEAVYFKCDFRRYANNYIPPMEGFALTTERQVYADEEQDSSSSSSGGSGGGRGYYEYTDTDPRYSSEAIYHERDGRNAFKVSTLTEQVAQHNYYGGLDTSHPASQPFSEAAQHAATSGGAGAATSGDPAHVSSAHPTIIPAIHPNSMISSARPFAVGTHNGFVSRASGRGGFAS
ncbi:DUF1190 domain-containing protein [Pseudomonas rubra]|uniref:DUF1190 domain-containing protein n=1 Tax=Pseudomonas rubra TaxID=2942627 RepID=A0ABT5P1U5_9PSED|nr:DUF1190 domain-containing protein [Pseudomonas rubra]MDD1012251.1 DUF1190 domain-containing protein [Pseudomonas rubra]MDD1037402.1 DUF1190 domain-containing protein [Pseudomonas rubra]MDD1153119.1 DUF1190 domain-containing protein [Pseudomonas rubra]